MTNPDRFLGRAAVYSAARPTYPAALGEWLQSLGLLSGRVADIGAGTGLFTRLLLEHGAQVDAVEPNPEMRAALLDNLQGATQAGQLAVHDGTSEQTGLADHSVQLVTAAQAAHWFEPVATVRELRRILTPAGRVLLVWNDWRGVPEPFNAAYRDAITPFYADGDNPEQINRVPEDEIPQFMPGGFEKRVFDNPVPFTREKLYALAGSVSYLPAPSDPQYPKLMTALDHAFDAHQQQNSVRMTYRTHVFLGTV